MYGRSSSTSGPGDFFLLFRGFRGSDRKPHSDDGRRDANVVHSPGKYLFSCPRDMVDAQRVLKLPFLKFSGPSFRTDYVCGPLWYQVSILLRGKMHENHYLTWNYRDIVRKCLRRTKIISKLSFSFFYRRLRILLWNIRSSLTGKNGMEKKRFIDYRSLDEERRYSLFRSYHSVRSLIGCTRGGGLVSRVGGVRYGWCMPYGQKKGSCWSDRMLIISTKASSCLLSPTWFADGTIIYAREDAFKGSLRIVQEIRSLYQLIT